MKNSEFIIGEVPITKEEIRAVSISKLELLKAKKLIDIGSGTGSITVEAAIKYSNLEVIAVEANESAYELTRKNIEKFDLKNVKQIKAMAPLNKNEIDFKEIDAIFIGGSKNNLKEILIWSHSILRNGGKIVANFILLESFFECKSILKGCGYNNIEVSQISVSNMEKLGRGNYFKPQNPIFIVSASK
ncbi:MAG: decarboxylating cobalt-precorrin-6B (C(15))-methyltransferase [Peptostreptococcus sp.]|uniref:decarboxylating cobalt-precorrin-6B (C(15))-methyltransferase n=1 Tax=Peptostreptococcus sp. TaxID=1262 RepID=UPI002FC955C0